MESRYLWFWIDRSRHVAVLRVRGELDALSADGFAVEAARQLQQVDGPVAVDLSLLDFADARAARTLAAVLGGIPRWQLVAVSGIRPPVSRVLDLLGIELSAPAGAERLPSIRVREMISQALVTRARSREVMMVTSTVMARLATTYAELAAARQRRAQHADATAERMRELSGTARDLSTHYRQRALSRAE